MRARKAKLAAAFLFCASHLAAAHPAASTPTQNAPSDKPGPRLASTAFACYYGYGRLEELKNYRLVVLQPSAYNPSDIAALKEAGVTVLAYISLGEDEELRRGNGRGPGGWADWYLDEFKGAGFAYPGPDGQPDKHAAWGSYYVDPSRSGWRKRALQSAERFKSVFGFDGLFLDTMLLPRDAFREKTERRMDKGMKRLLAELRRDWPGGYFLGNNAWEFLEQEKLLNGVMLESALGEDPSGFQKIGRLVKEVQQLRPLDAFLLETISPGAGAKADAVCATADLLGFSAALYSDDEAGRSLTVFPWKTCGPGPSALKR